MIMGSTAFMLPLMEQQCCNPDTTKTARFQEINLAEDHNSIRCVRKVHFIKKKGSLNSHIVTGMVEVLQPAIKYHTQSTS